MRPIPGFSLWLGHVGDVWEPQAVLSAGIRAVVDLALNERPAVLPRELVYCRFPLLDGAGNPPWLLRVAVETVTGLLRSGTPTLVYCGAGMSRSPCIAGAAVSLIRSCSASEGLALVTQGGPKDVAPALWREVQAVLEDPNAAPDVGRRTV